MTATLHAFSTQSGTIFTPWFGVMSLLFAVSMTFLDRRNNIIVNDGIVFAQVHFVVGIVRSNLAIHLSDTPFAIR